MKGLALSFHGWRGIFFWPRESDLFHFRITLGLATVWVCKFCVTDRITWLAKNFASDRDKNEAGSE